MNVLIIDDEQIARTGLKEYIEEISFLTVMAEAENPVEAMDILQKQSIDLMFCDIQMPLVDGIQFVKQLKSPPLIIFTTAYPNYAVQSYELDIVDYLLKPISFERFFKASVKANELLQLKKGAVKDSNAIISTPANDFCFIKTDKGFVKIFFDDILFIEAMHNYVVFNMATGKQISYLKLSNAVESLPAGKFIKIHKSYLINTTHIKKIQGESIWVAGHELPLSRGIKEEIMKTVVNTSLIQRKKE
jgi:two-component system LytT family response regulator